MPATNGNATLWMVRQDADAEIAIQTVLDSLDSPHSRSAYERHLRQFIALHQGSGLMTLNKAAVQRYAAKLRASGLSAQQLTSGFQQFASLPRRLPTMVCLIRR